MSDDSQISVGALHQYLTRRIMKVKNKIWEFNVNKTINEKWIYMFGVGYTSIFIR